MSRMTNFDATTPQLKVVKNWIDAHISLDMDKVEPLISKNYQYQKSSETIDLPKGAEGRHLGRIGEIMSATGNLEVTVHEVIEAPGKVVAHVTGSFDTILGDTLVYSTVIIITLVEEDGELKILSCKDFADSRMREALIAGVVKAAAHKASAS